MRFLRTILVGFLVGALLSSSQMTAQTADKFFGTWKLNLAQSKFSPGPGPKAITVTIEKAGSGFKLTATGTNGDGTPLNTSYTATYDGKDSPVTGSTDYDAVAVTMIDANTRHTVRKKAGKEVQTVHSVLSADGKHYTSTTTGVNARGEKVESVAVYDRQ